MTIIRQETPADHDQVRAINLAAFETPAEADIVDRLRRLCATDHLSLVAESDDRIVGHILFTPVTIGDTPDSLDGMGLAPMAVHPDVQNQGLGSQLVREGLAQLKSQGCPFVIVLGHPAYYPRFGFEPASRDGVTCQWPGVPADVFMILWFDETRRGGTRGVGRYHAAFDEAM